MKNTWWGILILAVVMIAAGFAAGFFWPKASQTPAGLESQTCLPGAMPAGYAELNALLLEFDDAATLAVNLPRELVVDEVEALQRIRREVDQVQVPACLGELKTRMSAYMNRVVDLLVGFVGGVSPRLVLAGLEDAQSVRSVMEGEMVNLIGVTLTPYPTPYQFSELVDATALVPVTGQATATPAPVLVFAEVTNADGVNLREGPGVTFSFEITIPAGTQVPIAGISADGLWVYVEASEGEGYSGWLYTPLVTLVGPIDQLPVIQP